MKQIFLISIFVTSSIFAQGVINNGTNIILSNNANIVINGTTGNYTNENGGALSTTSANGTVKLQGNWINNAVNVAFSNDGITTELNGTNQTIGGTNSTTFYNLTLSGSGTKTLHTDTKAGGISTTTGVVSLNAPLALNQHILEITNPATTAFTRTSGFVISETNLATNPSIIQWNTGGSGNYVFPFGASGDYIPISLNRTTTGASAVSVSTRATAANTNAPWTTGVTNMHSVVLGIADASEETAIDRWYQITPSSPIIADLTLSYRGAENTTTVSPTGTFAIQRWNGLWEDQQGSGTGVTSGVGTVTASGVSNFSTFVLTTSSTLAPLPVTLTQFTASCNNGQTLLQWTTASEYNADKFIVRRSRDGQMWQNVGEVQAVGNSSITQHYSISDAFSLPEIMYYTLVQVDLNGNETVYTPISSNCQADFENALSVYPNPTNNGFTVAITHNTSEENGTLQLMDISGKLIEIRTVNFSFGMNHYLFSTTDLAKGTYILNVVSADKYKPVKVVVF